MEYKGYRIRKGKDAEGRKLYQIDAERLGCWEEINQADGPRSILAAKEYIASLACD